MVPPIDVAFADQSSRAVVAQVVGGDVAPGGRGLAELDRRARLGIVHEGGDDAVAEGDGGDASAEELPGGDVGASRLR